MAQHLTVPTPHATRGGARRTPVRARTALLVLAVGAVLLAGNHVVGLHSAALAAGRIDDSRPTVARLAPALHHAVEEAGRDAHRDGVALGITSGWRSRAHQQRLLDEAVRRYGSLAAARRFVATPDTSAHVTGDAVDLGPRSAYPWLREHASAYGLCQVFANEPWHWELATTPGGDCPAMLPDSSHR